MTGPTDQQLSHPGPSGIMPRLPTAESWLDRYAKIVGAESLKALEALTRRLRGHRLVMVNTTKSGGGVAEILHRVVVILNELGVPTSWEIMGGDALFFGVTKKMHNALHGHVAPLTPQDREVYLERTLTEAKRLELDGDLILIHDPQPAAFLAHRRHSGQRWIWRCHIDLSRRDPEYWDFLVPWVSRYDATIFSAIEFVPPLPNPVYLVPPSIDPFSEKNRDMDAGEIQEVIDRLGLSTRPPLVTQVSRFDRIKDPIGVIEAFALLRARRSAQLLLAGGRRGR